MLKDLMPWRFMILNKSMNLHVWDKCVSSENRYEDVFDIHRKEYINLYDSFIKKGNFSRSCVLDVGCGTGRYTKLFSKERCNLVIGLDKSPAMLNKAREKGKSSTYICGEIEYLPFSEGIFNTIIMSQVIQCIENKEKAFSELRRVLSKKGVFLLNTLSHKQLSNLILMRYFPEIFRIEKERFPTIEELTKALKDSNFEIIDIEEIKERRIYTLDELVTFAEDKATSALRIYWETVGDNSFCESINNYKKVLMDDFPSNKIPEKHNYTLITCIKPF